MSDTRFAPIFTDHLVLQREKPIRLWGSCTPKASLRVVLCGESVLSSCEGYGSHSKESHDTASLPELCPSSQAEISFESYGSHFRAVLPAQEAGGPYALILMEGEDVRQVLRDVMIGEVWLAGGQSNMEFELQNDADASQLFAASPAPADHHGRLKGSTASGQVASDSSSCLSAPDPDSDSSLSSTSAVVPPGLSNLAGADSCSERRADAPGGAPTLSSLNVRFYQVLRQAYFGETFQESERANRWMTSSDPGFGTWSAVSFHFAKELSEALGCCVGIIGCNWGGTSASAWQDRESLLSHPETAVYWEEYQDILNRQSPEEYEKARREYALYQENWQPKINEFYAENPSGSWEDALAYAGPCLWPGPMGPKHEFRPCGLYETMLQRVTPYSLRGFLYYQGESDDHRPDAYLTLLRSLIRVWRRDFEDDSLSFLNVQLPMHSYENDPPSDSWAKIREAQLMHHREDPLSGLAVTIDLGEYNNIHPLHKKEVGHRLFLQSMTHVYQLLSPNEAYGPMLRSAVYQKGSHFILLEFDYAQSGFDRERYCAVLSQPHDSGKRFLQAFEVSDADGVYRPAEADFQTGDQSITLRIPEEITAPLSVRYLWINYSQVPLFDLRGMPAAPFRCEITVF